MLTCLMPWTLQAFSMNDAMGLLLKEGAFDSSPELRDHHGKWGAPIGPDGNRQVRAEHAECT